jgi:hypothetical protein
MNRGFALRDIYVIQDGQLEYEIPIILSQFPQVRLFSTGNHIAQVLALDNLLQGFFQTDYFFTQKMTG